MNAHVLLGLLLIAGIVVGGFFINKYSSAIFIEQYPSADYAELQNRLWD